MTVLTFERLVDDSDIAFSENRSQLDFIATQLSEVIGHDMFGDDDRASLGGFNVASFATRLAADQVIRGIEMPTTLDRDQFEDWFIGKAVINSLRVQQLRKSLGF